MRTTIWFLILLLFPALSSAEEPLLSRPHWSLEVKGGIFVPQAKGGTFVPPEVKDWQSSFGQHDMAEYATSLAYKILPWFELGAGVGSMSAKGQSYYKSHGTLAKEMTYELNPLDVFLMVRGAVKEDQWVVPYIAGGWTRMYYREMLPGQDTVRGSADGYHVRGGLQLSLNNLDSGGANRMYTDYGVYHTYFFIEAAYTRVLERTTSIDLGGTAYFGGLLFEF